jgi:hypothetical protein
MFIEQIEPDLLLPLFVYIFVMFSEELLFVTCCRTGFVHNGLNPAFLGYWPYECLSVHLDLNVIWGYKGY